MGPDAKAPGPWLELEQSWGEKLMGLWMLPSCREQRVVGQVPCGRGPEDLNAALLLLLLLGTKHVQGSLLPTKGGLGAVG